MVSEWEIKPLFDVADVVFGYPFDSKLFQSNPIGLPLIRIRDLATPDTCLHTTESEFPESVRVEPGDLLVGMDAEFRPHRWLGPSALLNQRVCKIDPKSRHRLDREFLRIALRGPLLTIENSKTGTTVIHLNKSDLERVGVRWPEPGERRAIAHILSTLDDKIELNRRVSETLERMARALFKSWFVDFDPVRAKVEGRDSGLPSSLADLFPARLVDSELGEIPEGWKPGRVEDLCDAIYSGGTPSTQNSEYWNGDVPWLSSGETRAKFIVDTERHITSSGVSNSSTRLAPVLSTVIASAGQGNTRGQTSLLTFESYVNQSVVVLTANQRASSPYHLFFDLERRYEEFRRISDAHSSRGSLTTKLLAQLPAVLPPKSVIGGFDGVTMRLVERIATSLRECRTLTFLREALLPMLVAGQLRVRDAEKFIGRTV